MATAVVFRGKAAVTGVFGAFDCIMYALQQSIKLTQEIDTEEVKDVYGYDIAWLFRNERVMFDCSLKLIGDTAAHSIIPATATGGGLISGLGQPFFAAGSTIITSTFPLTSLNGTYQILSGADVDLSNVKVTEWNLKLRKYADAADQLVATIPT